jgi:lipooligosaccharide transport system permease protein
MRQLSVGHFDASSAIHLGYFLVMSVLGVAFTTRRLRALFLR